MRKQGLALLIGALLWPAGAGAQGWESNGYFGDPSDPDNGAWSWTKPGRNRELEARVGCNANTWIIMLQPGQEASWSRFRNASVEMTYMKGPVDSLTGDGRGGSLRGLLIRAQWLMGPENLFIGAQWRAETLFGLERVDQTLFQVRPEGRTGAMDMINWLGIRRAVERDGADCNTQ